MSRRPALFLTNRNTNTNEQRSQWATSTERAALYVAQSQLELARLAYAEDPGSPIRIRARELADTLGELVEQIQRVGETREERIAR